MFSSNYANKVIGSNNSLGVTEKCSPTWRTSREQKLELNTDRLAPRENTDFTHKGRLHNPVRTPVYLQPHQSHLWVYEPLHPGILSGIPAGSPRLLLFLASHSHGLTSHHIYGRSYRQCGIYVNINFFYMNEKCEKHEGALFPSCLINTTGIHPGFNQI